MSLPTCKTCLGTDLILDATIVAVPEGTTGADVFVSGGRTFKVKQIATDRANCETCENRELIMML